MLGVLIRLEKIVKTFQDHNQSVVYSPLIFMNGVFPIYFKGKIKPSAHGRRLSLSVMLRICCVRRLKNYYRQRLNCEIKT